MASTYFHFFLILAIQFGQSREISITYKDRYLAGHIFAVSFPNDWLKCSLSCKKDSRCVSYNFHLEYGSCELNDHGLRKDFRAEEQLTVGKNFIFHQIRVGYFIYFMMSLLIGIYLCTFGKELKFKYIAFVIV